MNTLQRQPQIIRPEKQVQVVAQAQPFGLEGRVVGFEVYGLTVQAILCKYSVDTRIGYVVGVWIGDRRVPEEYWGRVKPKPGVLVTVKLWPMGGGGDKKKSGMMMVLSAILIVVGVMVPGFQFLIPMGITMGMNTAVTFLTAPPEPHLAELSGSGGGSKRSSPTLFISGARNRANPFGVVPVVLGEHRIVALYGAVPYTEEQGEDIYLRVLFCLGYGPLEITRQRIGDVDLDEFRDIEHKRVLGFPYELPRVSVYPDRVREDDYNILVSEGGGPIIRTAPPNADEISVDITFPRGIMNITEDGTKNGFRVHYSIDYRLVGSSGAWTNQLNENAKHNSLEALVNGHRWSVPEGHYDIRVTRDTKDREPEEDGDVLEDKMYLTKIRAFHDDNPVETPYGVALSAIRIQASDQLNGVIDQYNSIVRSIINDYGSYDLECDGFGDFLNARDSGGNVTGANHRSYEMWVKAEAPDGANASVFSWGSDNGSLQDFGLTLRTGIDPENWSVEYGSAVRGQVVVPGTVDGAWHHFAVTYDGVNVRLYVDGALMLTDARTLNTANDRLRIAARKVENEDPDVYDPFKGRIRDFRQWGYARSGAEILAQMNSVLTGNEDGLLSLFHMQEGSGDNVYDTGPGARHLEFGDHPTWETDTGRAKTWTQRPTSNPASCFVAILQGQAVRRPIADDRIDWDKLEEWHDFCTEEGFTYNFVIDFESTVFERLRHIASAGRASFAMRDGLFSVVIDREQSTAIQVFTPRNSRGFTGSKVFRERPTALRCRFVNAEKDWQQDERFVFDDGYGPESDNIIEELELSGITSPDLVWRHARFHLAQLKLRPEVFEIETDIEHLVCTRGDLVEVQHDVLLIGLGSGRVKSVHRNASDDITMLGVDEALTMEAGTTYAVNIRLEDGSVVTAALETEDGEHTTIRLAAPSSSNIQEGDLFAFGESGSESAQMLVKAIMPIENLGARLTLIDYAPGVYIADQGEIPPHDSHITLPPDESRKPPQPNIREVVSDESVMIRDADGSLRNRVLIRFSWRTGQTESPDTVQAQWKISSDLSTNAWQSGPIVQLQGNRVFVDGPREGLLHDFRVRVISRLGRPSDWSETVGHMVIGKTTNPPQVRGFYVTEAADGRRVFQWETYNQPLDVAGYKIAYKAGSGHVWEDMALIHRGLLVSSPWEYSGLIAGTYTFGIVAVDTGGRESLLPTLYEATLGDPPLGNVAFFEDAASMGWPGTITGGAVDEQYNRIISTNADDWDALPATWDAWTEWIGDPESVVYEHTPIDIGARRAMKVIAAAVANGTVLLEEAHSDDGVSYSSFATMTGGVAYITAQYVIVRASCTDAGIDSLDQLTIGIQLATVQEWQIGIDTSALGPTWRTAAGDIMLPVSTAFEMIVGVNVVFVNSGAQRSWELMDRATSPGPNVLLYDDTGTLADATIDFQVSGFK